MLRFLRQLLRDEKGQALPIVLALLAIGSLTIAVNLNYATTSLDGSGIIEEDMRGGYAAAAGVEQALWSLNNSLTPPTSISDNINQMTVSINTIVGTELLTLYLDDLRAGVHGSSYHISSNITPAGGDIYNFTITLTTDADAKNNAAIAEFGAMLPPGYTYVADSAQPYRATNLSYVLTGQGQNQVPNPQLDDPSSTGYDSLGSRWLKWSWTNKGPNITENATYTQQFQITGTGSTWGAYAWILGSSQDIGIVGQITGTLTTITSTARRPEDGKITAEIKAEAIMSGGGVYVFSWQITK